MMKIPTLLFRVRLMLNHLQLRLTEPCHNVQITLHLSTSTLSGDNVVHKLIVGWF